MRKYSLPLGFVLMTVLQWSALAQAPIDVREFYRSIIDNPPSDGDEIELATLLPILESLQTLQPAFLSQALPAIGEALEHRSPYVRRAALHGVVTIASAKSNSAELLAPYADVLGKTLTRADYREADLALSTFAYLRREIPPDVVRILIEYAGLPDQDQRRQAKALWAAINAAPHDETVIAAVEQMASRDIAPEARNTLLDGIGLYRERDARLVQIVFNGLSDTSPGVRTRSAYNIGQLGPDVIRQVATQLEQLRVGDPDPEVRQEADTALQIMVGGRRPE
jgi:HEAT repeat protein